jgi:hypothetical protein
MKCEELLAMLNEYVDVDFRRYFGSPTGASSGSLSNSLT